MEVVVPARARSLVLFAHGEAGAGAGPHHRRLAGGLRAAGLGTVLVELGTASEVGLRLDPRVIAGRIGLVIERLHEEGRVDGAPIGVLGTGTGAAAALHAAATRPADVSAVVTCGGSAEIDIGVLGEIRVPTRLLVGGDDAGTLREALPGAPAGADVEILDRAGPECDEPAVIDRVAERASEWFLRHLG